MTTASADLTPPPAVTSTAETAPVLAQHRFDEAALERYLCTHLAGFTPPLQVGQVRGGMSNPTFILTDGAGKRYVLRKKPPGKLLPSAHAVDREFRVISALWPTEVPVARPLLLCQDATVIGTDFYLMDFVEGRVFRRYDLPLQTPAERQALYEAMVDVLARLHQVDFRAVGLADFGRVGGYMARQIRRWSQQYEASKTEEIPAMERLMAWLPAHLPEEDETTLVHGDYRLENLIFHPTEPRVLAVVDWELSTLGAPLADLAYNCLPYYIHDDRRGDLTGIDFATYGIPSPEAYVARYCAQTGRQALPHWKFYLVFSLFRLAAIVQGVYKRGLDGIASSPEAITRKEQCRQLAETAWELVQREFG
ncbi:MAG: aminoglycoside phosphotransferase [Candidatus Tectimicrobiota bacterium]|nr:MAG: aminoglycoside phosphotransferase [Candidatus Tectomicrobia bacterium]